MDSIDRKILTVLQEDASATVAEIAERAGISSTPIWRRIKRMEADGLIDRRVTLLNPARLGLKLTGFVLIRISDHNAAWLERFVAAVNAIPEIVEAHRMAGNIDYILKVVAPDIAGYDAIYKRLIAAISMNDVSASFSMEVLKSTTQLPLDYVA